MTLGQRGVKLVIADNCKGLRAAASKVFVASQQRCRVHRMRNALAHDTPKQRPAVFAMIKTIVAQETAGIVRLTHVARTIASISKFIPLQQTRRSIPPWRRIGKSGVFCEKRGDVEG